MEIWPHVLCDSQEKSPSLTAQPQRNSPLCV